MTKLFSLTALLLIGPSAQAAVRIGVLPFAPLAGDVPPGAGDKGADVLSKEIKNAGEFELVPRQEAAGQDGTASVSEARQRVTEARAAVASHQGKAAVGLYTAALAAFAKGIQDLDSFNEFIEAEAELGALYYQIGQDDKGQKRIFDALRLNAGGAPKAVAGLIAFGPQLEALAKQVQKLGKGSIRVESTPSGADVFIDGQPAGKAPVLLRDLPEGPQYVRAMLPSGETWGLIVNVAARAETRARAQTGGGGPGGEVAGQLAANSLQPSILPALKKVAAASKVGYLVFGALQRTINGLALDSFLYSADKGAVFRLKRVAFDTEMLEAGLQMDKAVAEMKQLLGGGGAVLSLPGKAAPDLAAERELATEFHFGGSDNGPDQPPPAASTTDDQPQGSRVIHKKSQDSE